MAGKKTEVELKDLVDKVINKVTADFAVDEIILFGSYAKGTANDMSDVDIAIISPEFDTKNPLFENALKIKKQTKLFEPYLQLIAFASPTFYSEVFIDPGFIREIKNTGKVVYSSIG